MAVVIVVFAVSVFSVFLFFPLLQGIPRPIARAVGLAGILVFSGPEVFRPAVRPAPASVWPTVGWLLIAVGFGIATRNVASRVRVLGYAIVVVVVWLTWQESLASRYISNDWRRAKDADLQRRILTETPVGSSISQVEEVIRREGWELVRVDHERGFLDQRESVRRSGFSPRSVGEMHIQANAGDFQGVPFQSNVTIFWGFDHDGKLVDAWAWRTTNGL